MLKTIIVFVSFQSCLLYLGLCKGVFEAPFLSFTCYFLAHILLYFWVFHLGSVVCLEDASCGKRKSRLKKDNGPDIPSLNTSAPTQFNPEDKERFSRSYSHFLECLFSTGGIIIFAVILRVAFISYPLSDDVYRYAWEGFIQTTGVNPYLHSPEEFSAEFASDPIFTGINHKDYSTIYPPLSLLTFRGLSGIFYKPHGSSKRVLFAYKMFFIFCDLLVVIVLIQLLKAWNKPAHWLALYAWNPLIILYGSGEGHLDILQNVFITLALLYFHRHKDTCKAGYFLLGCAVMSKYLSLILLPFMVTRKNLKHSWLFCLPFLLFFIYWHPRMFTGLVSFAHEFHYNDFFPRLLRLPFASPINNLLCMALLFGGFVWIWLLRKDVPERGMGLSWGWTVLCLPTVHPWYLMPLLIFLLHSPSRSWMILSSTMGLNFWVYHHLSQTGNWVEFPWLFYGTYVPFLIMVIHDFGYINLPWHRRYKLPKTIDIVIPTLNEEHRLEPFLISIQKAIRHLNSLVTSRDDGLPSIRIYVVDGGSVDNTLCVAEKYRVKVIKSKNASRGYQIAQGVQAGQGDIVLMLHADAKVNEAFLVKLYHSLSTRPTIEWGILGHSYDFSTLKMRVIEFSNRLRFLFAGIAFGDQGIFVRRHLLSRIGGMPTYRLMEDVELSQRLAPFTCRINLGNSLQVSTRRWKKKTFTGYTIQVLGLVMTFLILRRLGVNTTHLTDRMYQIYYNKEIEA